MRPCGPALLAVEVAEGRSRGGAFHRCEGRLRSGAPPPPTARPLGALLGSATHVLWARVCGCGGPTLSPGLHAQWGLRVVGVVGGRPRGGWPATFLRGVWCQALSLPQPPVLWGGWPGFRDPCVPGAVSAGVGTQHRPHSVRPCGLALLAVGVAEGHSRRDAFHRSEGRLWSGAPPPPNCTPIGRAVRVRHPHSVVAGMWVWGPNTLPLACMPCGGCVPRGWWGAVLGGGGLLKRYPEPMAHGPEACEPSHPLWPMARRPVSPHTRAEAVDTGCQRDIPVLQPAKSAIRFLTNKWM